MCYLFSGGTHDNIMCAIFFLGERKMNKKRPRITDELKLLYATLVAQLGDTQQAIAEVNRQMLIHLKEKYDTYELSPDDPKDRDWCKKAFREANPNYPKYCPPDSKYYKYIEEQKTFLAGKKIKELNQRLNRRQLTLDNLIAAIEIPAISLLPEKIKEASADEIIKILSIILKLDGEYIDRVVPHHLLAQQYNANQSRTESDGSPEAATMGDTEDDDEANPRNLADFED